MKFGFDIGWIMVVALVGCGDDGGGTTTDAGDGSSGTVGGTSAASMTSTSSDPDATAGEGSGGGSSGDTTQGPGTSDTGDTGVAVDCITMACEVGEVCVVPCCGGAPPMCQPADPGGICPEGSMPVDANECEFGCGAETCCLPTGPCEPAPPFCAGAGDLVCGGDPRVADQCSLDDCFGTLEGGMLACQCA